MNRSTALTVVLALAAVVALSLSAATLDTATNAGSGSGFGSGPTSDSGIGSDSASTNDVGFQNGQLGGASTLELCTPWLASPDVVAGILAAFALLAAAVYWKIRSLLVVSSVLLVTGIPVGLVYGLLTSCRRAPPDAAAGLLPIPGNGTAILPGASGATGLNQAGEALSTPSTLLGLVLVVAVVGSVLALFVSTGDSEEPHPETVPESSPDPDIAAIGRAAGAAADRIESDADVENEVFRAWAEMTRSLDVAHPQSSTAGEFATAAVDAGMARDDVEELTTLFEDVRYGGAAATAEREERALAALRRIESTYAGIDSDAPTHAGGSSPTEGDR